MVAVYRFLSSDQHFTLEPQIEREIPLMCCFLPCLPWSELFQFVQDYVHLLTPLGFVPSITANRTEIGIITHEKSWDKNGNCQGKKARYHAINICFGLVHAHVLVCMSQGLTTQDRCFFQYQDHLPCVSYHSICKYKDCFV